MTNSSTFPLSAEGTTGQFFDTYMLQHVCSKCSAAVITDQSTVIMFCAFCGSPMFIAEQLVGVRKPDGVIPFKVDRAEATSALYEWCKYGIFTPVNFMKKSNIEKLTGIYVPFWLFDCDVDLDISADANTINFIHSGGRQSNHITKTTSTYKIIRKSKIHWEKIPFDGVSQVDDALMEDIEPFDYGAIEAFDMKHLTGFLIDKYDESPEALEAKLNDRLNQYCKTFFESSASQYSEISNIVDRSVRHQPISRYALFPVWMLNYKYLGKSYTFAMNGQTGKVSGKPPKSIGKILFLGLVILPALVFVFRYLGQWILGGL